MNIFYKYKKIFLNNNENFYVSPLYSVKVFDILQGKERAVIHIRS